MRTSTLLLSVVAFSCALLCAPAESARGGLFQLTQHGDHGYAASAENGRIAVRRYRNLASTESEKGFEEKDGRELVPVRPRRRLLASIFGSLLGAAQGANGIVSTVQSVLNFFGSQSSETLVAQFRNRGYSHIQSRTQVHVMNGLLTAYYQGYMRSLLFDVLKIDKTKFKAEAEHMINTGHYVQRNQWIAESAVFSTGKGGEATSFSVFYNRNYDCEVMNIVIVETKTTFNLGKDIFVISKMKAKFGGAFSNTKLTFSEHNRGLTKEEVQFVTTYFAALALDKIKKHRSILDAAGKRQTCSRRRLQGRRRLWANYNPDDHVYGVYNDELEDEMEEDIGTETTVPCVCTIQDPNSCCIGTFDVSDDEVQQTSVRRCTDFMRYVGRC